MSSQIFISCSFIKGMHNTFYECFPSLSVPKLFSFIYVEADCVIYTDINVAILHKQLHNYYGEKEFSVGVTAVI